MQHPRRVKGEVYLCATPVELYPFDESYMERLRREDGATQTHFAQYFGRLLRIKLRSHKLPPHAIGDVQQETFCRVLDAVRSGDVHQPDRLGAYVNSVCNNVLLEYFRDVGREQHDDIDSVDAPDVAADLEAHMISDERAEIVHQIMNRLPERDQAVLRGILLGRDKDEVCRELGVDRGYLRVLVHRAMVNFRELYKEISGNRMRRKKDPMA